MENTFPFPKISIIHFSFMLLYFWPRQMPVANIQQNLWHQNTLVFRLPLTLDNNNVIHFYILADKFCCCVSNVNIFLPIQRFQHTSLNTCKEKNINNMLWVELLYLPFYCFPYKYSQLFYTTQVARKELALWQPPLGCGYEQQTYYFSKEFFYHLAVWCLKCK